MPLGYVFLFFFLKQSIIIFKNIQFKLPIYHFKNNAILTSKLYKYSTNDMTKYIYPEAFQEFCIKINYLHINIYFCFPATLICKSKQKKKQKYCQLMSRVRYTKAGGK